MLTSQELIEELRELNYKVTVDSLKMNIYRPFLGRKIFIGHISFGEHRYNFLEELPDEFLSLLTEYILTPLEKRGEVKVAYYRIPLPYLFTTNEQQQYITLKDDTYFASKFNEKLKQTFNEEELEFVPKFYRNLAVKIED
ncbi:hypothetical protein [Gemella morbillorum]